MNTVNMNIGQRIDGSTKALIVNFLWFHKQIFFLRFAKNSLSQPVLNLNELFTFVDHIEF